ncbi:MAG: HAMP domain-containing histidine kinase, partial [Lysobacter sp.]|nr:HAMP domain-containing histidine kinase [Lysobacter sp.]
MRLPRATSTRLALAVAGTFLLACVLLGAAVQYTVSRLLLADSRAVIRADASGLVEIYRGDGAAALLDEIRDRVEAPDDPDAVYALFAHDGTLRAGSISHLPPHGPATHWVDFAERGTGNQPQRVVANLQRLRDGDLLVTGLRTRSQDRFLALMLRTALAALVAAATLGGLVGWATSRWVSQRLRALDATAARVGNGELGLRAPLDGSDDAFDRLARRFNGMLDRIGELLDGIRHATDHIAHDLRTPLTRLRNRLEELREEGGAPPATLEAAIGETDQLLQSFGALLRLARIEAQAPVADEPLLGLDALARDAIELYLPIAAERGIVLRSELAPALVRGDGDQLFQLLVNLLDNAVKFGAGGEMLVSVDSQGADAVLEIADHGPGIPASERERVFDRFQRLETHRGSPGTGLGLSLVRAIALR